MPVKKVFFGQSYNAGRFQKKNMCRVSPQADFLFKIHNKASGRLKKGYPTDSTQNPKKYIGTPNQQNENLPKKSMFSTLKV
jgi:hypothetical protein